MAASTFLVAAVATWVTERIVEPRLGRYTGDAPPEELSPLTREERRGLLFTVITGTVFVAVLLWGLLPAAGFLRDPESGAFLRSPFFSGIVAFIFLGGAALGIAFGLGSGTFRSDTDIMKGMGTSLDTMGGYLVLVFFAAQFVAFFNWTNLGLILAVKGAQGLQASGLGAIPLMLGFVVLSGLINLFMGSASAKWAIMAPVFVPMFMLLGFTPELVQAAYRVGDSVTNIISPMMAYFALIVAMVQKYDRTAGIGTVVATMLPYTVALTVSWLVFLVAWMLLRLPVGPGAGLYL